MHNFDRKLWLSLCVFVSLVYGLRFNQFNVVTTPRNTLSNVYVGTIPSFVNQAKLFGRSYANKAATSSTSSLSLTSTSLAASSTSTSTESSIHASPCNVKVVGVGGGGGNALMRMIETGVGGVKFVAINTDAQSLGKFNGLADVVNIGKGVTRGLGAGGIADNGRRAAEESRAEVMQAVSGADLVFITAGMGGGTGSGAAPVVATVAREAGALTVGVVTKPFAFEGRRRMRQALEAIETLRGAVDTLIVVSNDRLLQVIPENTPLQRAFSLADDVLRQGVVGISEIIIRPGLINVDFADVKTIMEKAGTALMGVGRGTGKTRAADAARAAISSPLLDFPIKHAKSLIFNVVGSTDMTLQEVNAAAEEIYQAVDEDANIIFGALIDESMGADMAVTVVATGFPDHVETDPRIAAMNAPIEVNKPGTDVPSFLNQLRRKASIK